MVYLEGILSDSRKVGLFKSFALQSIFDNAEGYFRTQRTGALAKEIAPLPQCCLVGHRVIIALEEAVALEGLDPTARFQDTVGLKEELSPIRDGANKPAGVNEVD